MAAALQLGSYRFSVEWAKVEPEEGVWNEAALGWYEKLLDHCEKNGLLPMLTLHHFTTPQWLAKKGGFANPESITYFSRYVKKVIERLGARVPLWCTFNEPMVLALGSYLGGFMPPAVQDPKSVSGASVNIFQAHANAYSTIHDQIGERKGLWRDHPLQVGIAHNMLDFLPDRWWHPLERSLAMVVGDYYNRRWLKAVTGKKQSFGLPGLIPAAPTRTRLAKPSADFIGVNYYTKAYVRWRPRDATSGAVSGFPLGIAFARRNEEQTDVGWAIHPSGFRKILLQAASFGLPLYVTENGIADRKDRWRGKYLLLHLKEIARLIAEGEDIRGYYHWSLMDNFEWKEGFGPRFGLFRVDYGNFEREARPSAQLYRRIIEAHHGGAPDTNVLSNFDAESQHAEPAAPVTAVAKSLSGK
jgi:beta-glucosidase